MRIECEDALVFCAEETMLINHDDARNGNHLRRGEVVFFVTRRMSFFRARCKSSNGL